MKDKKELVKFEAQFKRCLYPQPANLLGKDEDHKYGITKWEVIRNLTDKLSTTTEDTDTSLNVDRDGTITVVGNFSETPDKKNTYTILASRSSHPKYGEQFEIIYINTIVNLSDIKDVNAFLTSIAHPRQVKELYDKFDDPLKVIADHDITALTSVKGIGPYLANKLVERYEANKDDSDIYLELADYNLTSAMIDKLKMTYGTPRRLIEVIKTNPYLLSFDVDGVGFKIADKIAMEGGLSPKSSDRIAAYIYFLLTDNAVNFGNSYLRANEIITSLFDFFGGKYNIYEEYFDNAGNLTGNNIQKAIDYLVENDKILIEENSNKAMRRVFLKDIYLLETKIAENLIRIKNGENKFFYKDWEDRVKEVEKRQGFNFTDEQKAGIKLGLDSQVCLISGLGGSGKSSLVSGILGALEHYSFASCALSGKAAARIQELTGQKSYTIHKLLGYNLAGGFTYMGDNPLPYDIIILDEVSMVGGDIFLSLLQAIKTGTKLIMLGDMGQLESIGTLNLAKDMFNSPIIPTVNLTQVHRQAAKSGILTCAREVRECRPLFDSDTEGLKVFGEDKDMVFDLDYEPTDTLDKTMQWFKKAYVGKTVDRDINKIQLIAPVKERGDACVYNLNNEAQDFIISEKGLDKSTLDSVQLGAGTKTFRVYNGDKVMCIKNNYNIYLDDDSRYEDEPNTTAIFNGWVGTVYELDMIAKEIHVHFPLGEVGEQNVIIDFAQARNCLTLGYASTVHKLQGSDCPVVIGALDFSTPPSMLTCQLLYTLLTRAKKTCVVVGQTGALIKATLTDNVCIKKTFLPEFLEGNKITLEERCLK